MRLATSIFPSLVQANVPSHADNGRHQYVSSAWRYRAATNYHSRVACTLTVACSASWLPAASGFYHWPSLASVAPHSPAGAGAAAAAPAAPPHSSAAPSQLPPSAKPVATAAGPTSSAPGSFSSSTFSSASASGSRSVKGVSSRRWKCVGETRVTYRSTDRP
jgi:hypothetical protein